MLRGAGELAVRGGYERVDRQQPASVAGDARPVAGGLVHLHAAAGTPGGVAVARRQVLQHRVFRGGVGRCLQTAASSM